MLGILFVGKIQRNIIKMRRFSLLACFALLVATVLASLHSYRAAETEMSRDLDQALLLTMERKSAEYITPDTVRTYRSFIKSPLLRQCATLSYCLPDEQRTLVCSRKMMLRQGGNRYYLRGYANCSMAAVFSLSDQRLPMMLSMLTALCFLLACSPLARRKQRAGILVSASQSAAYPADTQTQGRMAYPAEVVTIGGLDYLADSHDFYLDGREVHFTPMQRQLMELFYQSDRHSLTKQQICDVLWPRKDNASETLYTLIKRLKQNLVDNGCTLQIVSDRGRAYRLEED